MSKVRIIDWRETSVYQKSMMRQETHPIQEADEHDSRGSKGVKTFVIARSQDGDKRAQQRSRDGDEHGHPCSRNQFFFKDIAM